MNSTNINLNRELAKEQIRSRLDIVDVVGRYVTLKSAGQNMKARCPFHQEKSASFMVNPARQIFHCFGCGKGGDVFSFLMEIEGLSFGEVMRRTAEEAGVKLESAAGYSGGEMHAGEISKETALKIHELAVRYYYDNMKNTVRVIEYFKKRGLTPQTVREFRLGYATDAWDGFVSYALAKKAGASALTACGLAIARSDGSAYDRFRDRVMFPICDISGRTIAFGGRTMLADAEPKYLNSPETVLYRKNRTLYGMHKSRPFIKQRGYAVLVEGYMDFLALYQAGIGNCAAVSGTALTEEHGRILRRFTSRVVLLFDGDSAGKTAAERAVYLLSPTGLDIRVLILPEEHDPDTYVQQYGAETLVAQIESAKSGLQYAMDRAAEAHGIDTAQGKSLTVNRLAPLIALAADPIVASEYARQIAEKTGIREQFIHDAARKVQRTQITGAPASRTTPPDDYASSLEGGCIALLVHYPALVENAMERISPETFTDTFSMNLYSLIVDSYGKDSTLATLMNRIEDSETKRVLAGILLQPLLVEDAKAALDHALVRLDIKYLKARMRAIRGRLKEEQDEGRKRFLLGEQQIIAQRLKELGER